MAGLEEAQNSAIEMMLTIREELRRIVEKLDEFVWAQEKLNEFELSNDGSPHPDPLDATLFCTDDGS